MKVIVALIVVTDYPNRHKNAVLRRRASPPYPGSYMATLEAECDEEDDHYRVLQREAARTLDLQTLSREQIINLNHSEKSARKRFVNYGLFLFHEYLDSVMHGKHRKELRFVSRADLPHLVDVTKDFEEKTGITDPKVTALFPDLIKAVRMAHNKLHIPAF